MRFCPGARAARRGRFALCVAFAMLNCQMLCQLLVRIMVAASPASVAHSGPLDSAPTPGRAAPDIIIQKLLNAPEGTDTTWIALRGKVVVLEFWATHCASCVRAIPLMNTLEAAFVNQPVAFLHITNEDEATIREFLDATPIRGWIGIDNDRTTMKTYGVTGLPRTAIVGKDGRFLGWTNPFRLVNEPEILVEILKTGSSPKLWETQPSLLDPLRDVPRAQQGSDPRDSLCDIVIRHSTSNRPSDYLGGDSRGQFRFAEPLAKHISFFWDVPPPRIIAETTLPEGSYDIVALTKRGDTPEFGDVVRRLIEVTFDLSVNREKRVMNAYVLRPLAERDPQLAPSLSGFVTDKDTGLYAPNKAVLERMKAGEHFFIATCPLSMLADAISPKVNKPVVAELGGLPTTYDDVYTICFTYDEDKVTSLIEGLEKHVGFTLIPEQREVDVLVVRNADRAPRPP